ncbi:hypothetical protein Tco_0668078 [Tanacetum coccineum]
MGWVVISDVVVEYMTPSWDALWRRHIETVTPSPAAENIFLRNVGVGKFWTSPRIPSYFNDRDATLIQLLDLPIHDFNWLFNEVDLSSIWISSKEERVIHRISTSSY